MHLLSPAIETTLLSRQNGENDNRNNSMINLHERYVAELGFELATPGSAVRRDTNCDMEPGDFFKK